MPPNKATLLNPSTFQLPLDQHHELWTFRVPINMNIQNLNTISLNNNANTIKIQNKEYMIQSGESFENESFRLLVSGGDDDDGTKKQKTDGKSGGSNGISDSDSDDDSSSNNSSDGDDDDDTKKNKMVPCKMPFRKHWNVVEKIPEMTERQLAPRLDEAPPVEDETQLKKAYAHVPQRAGLKRRWMPLGSKVKMDGIAQSDAVAMEVKSSSSPPQAAKRIKTSPSKTTPAAKAKPAPASASAKPAPAKAPAPASTPAKAPAKDSMKVKKEQKTPKSEKSPKAKQAPTPAKALAPTPPAKDSVKVKKEQKTPKSERSNKKRRKSKHGRKSTGSKR